MKKRPRKRITLNARLTALATPMFLLDERRRVIFFNGGCTQLTGWMPEDVLGRQCDYTSEAEAVAALTASLCPPPEVFSGQPATVPAHLVHKDGSDVPRLLNFFPLTTPDGELESVLGIVTELAPPRKIADITPAQRLHAELASLRGRLRQRFGLRSFVARTAGMRRVVEQIQLARAAGAAVALQGEPGTGKEHIARMVHYEGEKRTGAFVPLDCRALPAIDLKLTLRRLLEGDEEDRGGPVVPMLNPGAVYLANVERLPREVQEYVLECYGREPGERPSVRLLAGTSARLEDAVAQDELLPAFFYLITPMRIELPPLRDRPEDLTLLAQSFLEALNRDVERQVGGFAEAVWREFRKYNWPGNLDELAAVVREACAAATGDLVQMGDLPFRFRAGVDAQAVGPAVQPKIEPLEPMLARIEREQIELALSQARQNKSKAAELLGLTRPRLYRRMQALGIVDVEGDGSG